ncbi:MAG: biotin--[acetyl-CoA-carboxylase] ligase [Rikenellaceae bacterium]
MIYHFDTLGSTNDEAQSEKYNHGDLIVAERQTAGRGQRGHTWISGEGLNLTLSAIVTPVELDIRRQFLVSQASALAICDMLRSNGLDARIKWTNDIYIGDRKIVGILIENRVCAGQIARSIVGIGLNINQVLFDPSLPNPTSMALEVGTLFDRETVLAQLSKALNSRFEQLANDPQGVGEEYRSLMYRRDELHTYRLKSGELRVGSIRGVEYSGELLIEWANGEKGAYLFGEVEFIIESRKR